MKATITMAGVVLVCCASLLWPSTVWANSIASSTMHFEGALTDAGGGVYTGTIAATTGGYYCQTCPGSGDYIGGTGYPPGPTQGGFDLYAREGATAYYDDVAQGTIGVDHDAYSSGGGWGDFYQPDVADWDHYELTLAAGNWYVRYVGSAGATPMSGTMDWSNMFAAETDTGQYVNPPADPDANDGGAAALIGGSGAGHWDMDWTWGSEAIPLELAGFDVVITDLTGGQYHVTLTPANPTEVWVDDDFNSSTPGWGVTHFASIQAGIDAVSGSTVNVAPGTYEEQIVITTNNLQLVGSGSGNNPAVDSIIQSPTSLAWSYTTTSANYPIVGIDGVTGVSVEGFRIDGLGRGNANYRFQGVGFWNAGGDLTDCSIVNVMDTPFSGAQHGVGVYAYNNTGGPYTVNLTNTDVIDYQKGGIALNGTGLTGNVTGCNTFGQGATAVTAQNGIQFYGGSGGTITGCTVDGNIYTGASWAASGILLISAGSVAINDTIVTDGDPAVYCQDTDAAADGLTIANVDPDSGNGFYARGQAGTLARMADAGSMIVENQAQPFGDAVVGGKTSGDKAGGTQIVSIDNSTIAGSCTSGYGVSASNYVATDTITMDVTNSTITNWAYGFVVFGSGGDVVVTASSNAIFGNEAGFYSALPGQVAQNNWWGDASGPLDDGGTIPANNASCADVADIVNASGLGDYVFDDVVEYCPWLESYPRVTLEPDSACYEATDTVTVNIWMHDIAQAVVGGQFFLAYDDSILSFSGAAAGSSFVELFEATPGAGLIDYAVQIPPTGSVTGDELMATLTFTANAEICSECDLITWRAHQPPTRLSDDAGGAIYPALAGMNVIDSEAPVITGTPTDTIVECDFVPSAPSTLPASDNCDASVTQATYDGETITAGACTGDYTITRTWTATDHCGNSTTTTQVITVEDTTAPVVTGTPLDTIVECDSVPVAPTTLPASDNCDSSVTEATYDGETITAGICTGEYTITRTWTAVDDCGNSTTTTQVITVEDTTGPIVTGTPADTTVECNAVPTAPSTLPASDNCDLSVTQASYDGETITPGACTDAYSISRTWTAVDDCGNSTTTTQVITVQDTTAPVLSGCPGDFSVSADAGGCDALVTYTPPTATDNCDGAPVVTCDWPSGSVFPGGPTLVTCTAEDDCGNTSNCGFTVTVNAVNDLYVDVELAGSVASPLTRCITFELWECPSAAPAAVVTQDVTFTSGLASGVLVEVPCGSYACITARDELHTLRRTDTDDFGMLGTAYVADFTASGAVDDDSLIGGNLNDDFWIDILDFGIFSSQWAQTPSGDTPCPVGLWHADINGDAIVSNLDFSFIQNNFLAGHDANCCGALGLSPEEFDGPVTDISVLELREMGLGSLRVADLNHDGRLNMDDVAAFLDGARPRQLNASRKDRLETGDVEQPIRR